MKRSPLLRRTSVVMPSGGEITVAYILAGTVMPSAAHRDRESLLVRYVPNGDGSADIVDVHYIAAGTQDWVEVTPDSILAVEIEALRGTGLLQDAVERWLKS